MNYENPAPDPAKAAQEFRRPPDVGKVLNEFLQTTKQFEASADELVRVRMNAGFVVEELRITEERIDPGLRKKIEQAAMSAVNAAIRKAALAAGEILANAPRETFERSRGSV